MLKKFEVDDNVKIAVIGLGYVGLPLAVEFSKKFNVIGFDNNKIRIEELEQGIDLTLEVNAKEILESAQLIFTSDTDKLLDSNFYIVTVPTPINSVKAPDLDPIISASSIIARYLNEGDIVVYESTVYPGLTEEVCIPLLEKFSGLTLNADFYVGYSPERLNPGDSSRGLSDIVKVTSGSTENAAHIIDSIYLKIIKAGTFMAPNIKTAEAAKVIENVQRDVNIALINEVALLFGCLGLDTSEVLEAARTKWNFLDFRPGLVGGHCISVDPYYLTHKALQLDFNPEMILAGRRTNDGMPRNIVQIFLKGLIKKRGISSTTSVLVLGLTFKENCPDMRNSKVIDVIQEFQQLGIKVDAHDPYVDPKKASKKLGLEVLTKPIVADYSGIFLAVGHDYYQDMGPSGIRGLSSSDAFFFDLKSIFSKQKSDGRL